MKVGDDMAGKGVPKKFKSGAELIGLWIEFCDAIRENNYNAAPTQTAFCRWLAENFDTIDRRTIYNSLNDYFPNVKKDFEAIRADVIAEGTMLGKYQPTMSIFALKNWCSWSDRTETVQLTADDVKQDALSKSLEDMAEELTSDD